MLATKVDIRRPRRNVVEYDVTYDNGEVRTYHANRVATFFGPHDGKPAMQTGGGATTLWRDDDVEMLRAFQRAFGRVPMNLA
ncbi:MAG: hypothetical protein RJA36_1403 [Pseudomonadota bacterium]|jgi:hypothetical protein